MKKFLIKILIISAIIFLIGLVVFEFVIPQHYLPVMPYMLLFFVVVTLLTHALQVKSAGRKSIATFTRNNMLSTMLKLFLYTIFAVVYIALNPDNALPFVICLMLLYIVYTIAEVAEMMELVKK